MRIVKLIIFKIISFFIRLNSKIQKRKNGDPNLFELDSKHLKNLKVISNRDELLKLLPHNSIVAEMGVDKGEFSEKILNITTPKKLFLIDAYHTKRYSLKKYELVKNKFINEINDNIIELKKGYSTEFASQFLDNFFDWIYIDTDHTYYTTKSELELYAPKIKPGGFICGHDYVLGNWNSHFKYGVIEAVREFCVNYDWELVYLTFEGHSHHSFCIRKL
jgi:hypothetical protein